MKINKNILSVLVIPVIITFIFIIAGFMSISLTILPGVILISAGVYIVYKYMGAEKDGLLFIGSSMFLTGLMLFILNYYNFPNPGDLIFSAVLFIISINFILLFINRPKNLTFIYLGAIFFIAGWFSASYFGALSLMSLLYTIIEILKHYWIVLLLIIVLLYYFKKND